MSTKTNKLKTKDLIVAGAFAALYVVVLFAVVTVMGFVPILYLIAPFVNSVILGCIYMMYVTKVPKTGAILILAVAVGLLTSTGGVWVSLIWCLALGIVAELIARAGNHKSKRSYIFIPTISEEWHSIRDAMRFRGIGISVRSVLTKPMMTLEYTMVPLLMSTATISDELAAASLSRGLDADTKRTCIEDVRLRTQDYLLILFSIVIAVTGGMV